MSDAIAPARQRLFTSVRWRINAFIIALCVVPPLWSSPGHVSADTKSYLYLDPARLLSRATSLWDPSVGAGTVAHQMAGYLWPMGPYFWFMDALGCPDWIAQRLWWSLLALAATFGVLRLARLLGVGDIGAFIAALVYGLSPYSLQYLARLSGLLTPWALLPWMLICVVRARDGRLSRWGLALGALVATAGSVNVTALAMVFIGVIVWMLIDVVTGAVRLRRQFSLLVISLTTSLVCGAWWVTALLVQGRYGLPILRYTETYETVAKASTPQEILRGLGYWFFYGSDHSGAWVNASTRLIGTTPLLAVGMLMSAAALVALGAVRHRHTRHCVALLVVGLAVAVGANPQGAPSLYGRLFEAVVNNESGFALRSSPRATPVLLIALAVSLGVASDRLSAHLRSRAKKRSLAFSWGLIAVLILAQNYPWVAGRLLTPSIARDEQLPAHWRETARAIEDSPRDPSTLTRAYELPGVDFATYTWGGTIDPVTPGLIDSQYIARELVPYGSDATADLLNAYETRIQEGRFESSSLKDFAALIGADTISFRGDIRYDTYRTPNPGRLWRELADAGLALRQQSEPIQTTSSVTIADATFLAHPRTDSYPTTAVMSAEPQPLVTVSPLDTHTRLVGSGEGVVDAVSALGRSGLGTFVYDATATITGLDFGKPARVLVTDSNRRQSRRWYSVGSNLGRTERSDEVRAADPSDNRLMPFVDDHTTLTPVSTQSVSLLVGDIKDVTASDHGHPIVSTPEDRPENALDGDPYTSWRTGIIGRSIGQHLDVTFVEPVTTSETTLVWPRVGNTERRITKGHLLLRSPAGSDTKVPFSVDRTAETTRVSFSRTTFDRLRVVIDDDTFGVRDVYDGLPGTGIAEVVVPGVTNAEYVLLPRPSSDTRETKDITYVLSRWRLDEATPNRSDPEARMLRAFDVDAEQPITLTGSLRLNGNAPDSTLVEAMGIPTVSATSNRRMLGSPYTSAINVLDDDDTSAWVTPLDDVTGSTITFKGLRPSRSIAISFIDDAWHSRPKTMSLSFSDGSSTTVTIPDTGESVTVQSPPDTSALVAITIKDVTSRTFPDYFSTQERQLPVAITEISVDSGTLRDSRRITQECRSDLLRLNGTDIPVRILSDSDTSRNPWSGDAVTFESCDPLSLRTGRNYLVSTSGRVSGWNVDRIIISPQALTGTSGSNVPSLRPKSAAKAEVTSAERTRIVARVDAQGESIVALATSNNKGWSATFTDDTGTRAISRSFVVNGYSHGVIVPGPGVVTFEWSPQKWYRYAMWLSLFGGIATLVAIFILSRRSTSASATTAHARPRVSTLVNTVALLTFLVAAPPVAAGFLAVIVVLSMMTRPARPNVLVSIAGIAYLALTTWTVVSQIIQRYPVTLDWPGRFADLGVIAWIAVGFVALVGWTCDVPQGQQREN